jgi:hypothetical protein
MPPPRAPRWRHGRALPALETNTSSSASSEAGRCLHKPMNDSSLGSSVAWQRLPNASRWLGGWPLVGRLGAACLVSSIGASHLHLLTSCLATISPSAVCWRGGELPRCCLLDVLLRRRPTPHCCVLDELVEYAPHMVGGGLLARLRPQPLVRARESVASTAGAFSHGHDLHRWCLLAQRQPPRVAAASPALLWRPRPHFHLRRSAFFGGSFRERGGDCVVTVSRR